MFNTTSKKTIKVSHGKNNHAACKFQKDTV